MLCNVILVLTLLYFVNVVCLFGLFKSASWENPHTTSDWYVSFGLWVPLSVCVSACIYTWVWVYVCTHTHTHLFLGLFFLWFSSAKPIIRKDPDAGKDRRREEKGTTEDEMVGWQHGLNAHKFDQVLEDGDEQGSLLCCSPWGCRVGPNWVTEQQWTAAYPWHLLCPPVPCASCNLVVIRCSVLFLVWFSDRCLWLLLYVMVHSGVTYSLVVVSRFVILAALVIFA